MVVDPSGVFGLSLSLPQLVSDGGGLVCESVAKADLPDHFDSKQPTEAVDLQLTCHPSPSLPTFAFRLREVRRLLLLLIYYYYYYLKRSVMQGLECAIYTISVQRSPK